MRKTNDPRKHLKRFNRLVDRTYSQAKHRNRFHELCNRYFSFHRPFVFPLFVAHFSVQHGHFSLSFQPVASSIASTPVILILFFFFLRSYFHFLQVFSFIVFQRKNEMKTGENSKNRTLNDSDTDLHSKDESEL